MTQHNVDVDELHCIFLGTHQAIHGSVLWVLCWLVLPGSPAANCRAVWSQILEYYRANAVATQYNHIDLSTFAHSDRPGTDFPRLRGKGAECKDLTAALLHVWEGLSAATTYQYQIILDILAACSEMQSILSCAAGNYFLSTADAKRFQHLVQVILSTYSHLASVADSELRALWPQIPKLHYLHHLAERAYFINPRTTSCWVDEDYVGKVKAIVQACTLGTPMHLVPQKVAEKMQWVIHLDTLF